MTGSAHCARVLIKAATHQLHCVLAGFSPVLAIWVLFPSSVLSQTPSDQSVEAPSAVKIETESLVSPRLKKIDLSNQYPISEVMSFGEGWVQLGFMVDSKGKPFEVTVEDSNGDKLFEKAAIKALEDATYEPGRLNGKAVESSAELKITFKIPDGPNGATTAFVSDYRSLTKAIKSNNRAAAESAMKSLASTNLYEDAYLGLAQFLYARQWGDESQQLRGLLRAIAYESTARYLPEAQYNRALVECFKLQVKQHLYGEATHTGEKIRRTKIDPASMASIKAVMAQVMQLSSSNDPYDINGEIATSEWKLQLFKRHFRATVREGHITAIKLKCENGFVRFEFDPTLEYQVANNYGDCTMKVEGDPGTRFILTQF
jgi:TonB family protein